MRLVKMHADDDIAVASEAISAGETFSLGEFRLTCTEAIPPGGKVALHNIPPGTAIIKRGFPIGLARKEISAGEAVTEKNLKSGLKTPVQFRGGCELPALSAGASFTACLRPDGRAGIRNGIWIIPLSEETVELSHSLADLCETIRFPNVDGVTSYSYPYFSQERENGLKKLAMLTHHPNAGGVLIPLLYAEEPDAKMVKRLTEGWDNSRIRFLDCRLSENAAAEGMKLIHELAASAEAFSPQNTPASELVIGILCAYPDVFTGITANPLLGVLTDKIIAQGGSVILACPKLSGAGEILAARCLDETVFQKAERMILSGDSKRALPGITTPEEQAVFYLQQGGTAPVTDILANHDPIRRSGLNLLAAPGGYSAAVTALTAAGAQIIVAACGEAVPAAPPVPVVSIASSGDSALRYGCRYDFNAGSLVENKTMAEVSDDLWNYVLSVCSRSEFTKNENIHHKSLFFF